MNVIASHTSLLLIAPYHRVGNGVMSRVFVIKQSSSSRCDLYSERRERNEFARRDNADCVWMKLPHGKSVLAITEKDYAAIHPSTATPLP